MRRDYAIYLLVFYLSTFLGYNLLNVGHTLLHLIPNPFHHHHLADHYGLVHDLSDHNHALKALEEAEHETEKPESSVKAFYWFVYVQQFFNVSFEPFNFHVTHFGFIHHLIPQNCVVPPTPPPNSSNS